MKEKQQLRKMFEEVSGEFKSLGTKHAKHFIIALEKHVEMLEGVDSTDYLMNYFKACTRKHGNNLGCNQATSMLSSAYNKVFGMTV